MASGNTEIVRRVLEQSRSGDLDALMESAVELWDPSCEFTSVLAAVQPETYRGHDGLRRYFGDMSEAWEEWRLEVEDVFEAGSNMVIATFRSYLVGKGSGAAVQARRAMVAEVSHGKLLRARVYESREEALEAVEPHE